MQIRCTYCQNMFALSRDEMLAALEHMEENKLIYHDAHCPRCRRANRVEKVRMERFFPEWKKTLKALVRESSLVEGPEAKPVPAAKPAREVTPSATAARLAKKPASKTFASPAKKAAAKKPAAKPAGRAAKKPARKVSTKPAVRKKK